MKKTTIAMIVSSAMLAAAILPGTLLAFAIKDKNELENSVYERAYAQASDAAEKLAASLDAAYTHFLPSDVAEVKHRSELLLIKLSELSLETEKTQMLQRFLSLTSDVSQRALYLIDEGKDSEFYRDLFSTFAEYAHRLDDEFLPVLGSGDEYGVLDDIFSGPSEIYYDGLYSDEPSEETFSLLKNAPIMDADEVLDTVKELFGENAKLDSVFVRSFPTVYNFYCENASVDISQMGGFVLRMLYDRRAAAGECGEEEALGVMSEFLSERGLGELVPVETFFKEDHFGIFAPVINEGGREILCLSESVKLCVGADCGRVVAYDAENYYKYHKNKRETGNIRVPDGARLVYMITSDGRETLCYEEGGEYFNAENGRRETKIY